MVLPQTEKKVLPACPSIHNSHSQRLAVSQSIRTDHPPTSHSPYLKRFSPLHTIIYSLQNLCCPYTNTASVGEIYYLCSAAGYSARSQGAGRWSRWGGRSQILWLRLGRLAPGFKHCRRIKESISTQRSAIHTTTVWQINCLFTKSCCVSFINTTDTLCLFSAFTDWAADRNVMFQLLLERVRFL